MKDLSNLIHNNSYMEMNTRNACNNLATIFWTISETEMKSYRNEIFCNVAIDWNESEFHISTG